MSRQQQFEEAALVHSQALLRMALRLTHERAAAEDLAQETLLRAWRAFDQFEPGTNAKAWLFRILLNLAGRKRRQAMSTPPVSSIDEPGAEPPAVQPRMSNDTNVLRALEHLPEEFRMVLLLAVVEGFTCKEIAAMLAIPMGTVMSRLSRARKGMRKRLLEMEQRPLRAGIAASPQPGGMIQ